MGLLCHSCHITCFVVSEKGTFAAGKENAKYVSINYLCIPVIIEDGVGGEREKPVCTFKMGHLLRSQSFGLLPDFRS